MGGVAQRSQAAGAGNRVKTGEARAEALARPAGVVEQVTRAWSAPLKAGYGRCGAPVFRAHGSASSRDKPTARRPGGGKGVVSFSRLRLFLPPIHPRWYTGWNWGAHAIRIMTTNKEP